MLLSGYITGRAKRETSHGQFLHLAACAGVLALTSVAVLSLAAPAARSQTARTLKIVVPFAPCGAASILARLLADQIAAMQGQIPIVENRPGAGTSLGTESVARAALTVT